MENLRPTTLSFSSWPEGGAPRKNYELSPVSQRIIKRIKIPLSELLVVSYDEFTTYRSGTHEQLSFEYGLMKNRVAKKVEIIQEIYNKNVDRLRARHSGQPFSPTKKPNFVVSKTFSMSKSMNGLFSNTPSLDYQPWSPNSGQRQNRFEETNISHRIQSSSKWQNSQSVGKSRALSTSKQTDRSQGKENQRMANNPRLNCSNQKRNNLTKGTDEANRTNESQTSASNATGQRFSQQDMMEITNWSQMLCEQLEAKQSPIAAEKGRQSANQPYINYFDKENVRVPPRCSQNIRESPLMGFLKNPNETGRKKSNRSMSKSRWM